MLLLQCNYEVVYLMQEALDMRSIDELKHVHLIHSIIEVLVTLLIIVLRMINTRMGYVEVQV